MSFFCDVLYYFKLNDINDNVLISLIPGNGVVVYGDFKIKDISENNMVLCSKKDNVFIAGENLKISTITNTESSSLVLPIETLKIGPLNAL